MSDYDNTNTGAMFKNKKKTTDKHPDYTGQANVAGVEYWVSYWLKKSKAGETYMSSAYTLKEDKNVAAVKEAFPESEVVDKTPF